MIHGTVAHLGSSVHGILQARILECGLSWPPPGDLPDPGIKLASPVVSCIGREFFTTLYLFKKAGDTKGKSHAKMVTIKDRNGKEAEEIKKR